SSFHGHKMPPCPECVRSETQREQMVLEGRMTLRSPWYWSPSAECNPLQRLWPGRTGHFQGKMVRLQERRGADQPQRLTLVRLQGRPNTQPIRGAAENIRLVQELKAHVISSLANTSLCRSLI